MRRETFACSDNVSLTVGVAPTELTITHRPAGPCENGLTIFVALRTHGEIGSAILPFGQHAEGSTVFLPFKADLILSAEIRDGAIRSFIRRWEIWRWSERESTQAFAVSDLTSEFVFRIPRELLGETEAIDFVVYAKDPNANDGWGWFWGCSDPTVEGGIGDKYIPHYHELQLEGDPLLTTRSHSTGTGRVRIYQLFVRLFGNTNETRERNGTLTENGVGKFADIDDAALASIREMGFTHIWLTGVLQQATATDYSQFGQPADDTDLLKGLAGSPYAIKDYFDVCPDYATNPARRLEEFRELVERLHAHGLKAIIDLVPNHVARSYESCVKPDWNFGTRGKAGAGDDTTKFFHPHNNFFYLTPDENGPPLRLPTFRDGEPISSTCQAVEALGATTAVSSQTMGRDSARPSRCDGLFAGEMTFGRVTGNNVVSWTPQLHDWYETIKLNYGFDFTDPSKSVREYPNAWTPDKPIPDTWTKIDQVIAHWQSLGVDGFRCDMSHMVPPEMWSWTIAQARRRQPDVFFMGEAYDDDPAKVPGSDPFVSRLNFERGNALYDLLNAGFNAVYDAPVYRALKRIYDGGGWANDIDREITHDFLCHNSVRYAENHDEVRLAARHEWGGVGMEVGRPVSAILYGLSRGTVMLYNGQEVGEPAEGAEGFGGDDGRTSIFDYWSMPEFTKWVNDRRFDGGRLSAAQRELRKFYSRLINLVGEPAFADGKFFPLNPANRDNPNFGRLPNETCSGHWLYAFLRYDPLSGQRFMVVANLHPVTAFSGVDVLLPDSAVSFLGLNASAGVKLRDRLADRTTEITSIANQGIPVPEIPPLSACYFELNPL